MAKHRGRSRGAPSPGGSRRAEQVAAEIAQLVSSLLVRDVADPRLRMVAITRVKVSPDLSTARILFSVIGDDRARDDAQVALEHAAPFFRRQLAASLALRRTPEIVFAYDTDLAGARRVDSLLRGLRRGDPDA